MCPCYHLVQLVFFAITCTKQRVIVTSATTYSVLKDYFWNSASGQFSSGSVPSVKGQLVDDHMGLSI